MQVNAKCNSSEGSSPLNPQSRDTQNLAHFIALHKTLSGFPDPTRGVGDRHLMIMALGWSFSFPRFIDSCARCPFVSNGSFTFIYMMTFFVKKSIDDFIHLSTWKTNKMKMKIFSPVCLAKHHINNPQRLIQSSDKNSTRHRWRNPFSLCLNNF